MTNRPPAVPPETLELVFRTAKAGLKNEIFLSSFESGLVRDFAYRYGRYGLRTNVTDKQLFVFQNVAQKLFLPFAKDWDVPEVDIEEEE